MKEQSMTETTVQEVAWRGVTASLLGAKAIAWDTCHKIYVLMDDEQVEIMRDNGYDPLIPVTDRAKALATLKEWYEESCSLRFITAVATVEGNPNDGYVDLIEQFDS